MPANPHRVAVVDDEPDVRRAMQRLLRSAGFSVDTYASGDEFLGAVGQHDADCVVLDLHMPGLSGLDVQQCLRERGATIPVIVVTGHDSDVTRERTIAAGASAYLCKPVDGDAILAAIERAIAAHRH